MKKILLFAVPVLFFAACNPKTELAIKNGTDSDGTISDVVWNDSNGNEAVSFSNEPAIGAQTEAKETDVLNGKVTCAVEDGGDFYVATVTVAGGSSESASINEGESNVLTVAANNNGNIPAASIRKAKK
jgi:hypothetical protein